MTEIPRRLSTSEINNQFLASTKNSELKRRIRRSSERGRVSGLAVALVGALALVTAIGAIRGTRAGEKQSRGTVATEIAQLIPAPNEPYRTLTAGTERGGAQLINVVSLRDYIYQTMRQSSPTQKPPVSRDTVADLIMAENIDYQSANGVPPNQLDRITVTSGQVYRLPSDWGVGRLHEPIIKIPR